MSNDTSRIEIITGRERRRRYSAEHKLQLVEATMQPGMTVSAVARLHGVSPSLLFKWRQLISEGGRTAVRAPAHRRASDLRLPADHRAAQSSQTRFRRRSCQPQA